VHAQHGKTFGEKMALQSKAKDTSIVNYAKAKGLTRDQFSALSVAQKNDLLRELNTLTGKKHNLWREGDEHSGASINRLLDFWKE